MVGQGKGAGTALITAGTTGSGLEIALKIAKPGMKIFLDYIDDESAAPAAAAVSAKGAQVFLIKEDVGSAAAGKRIIERVAAETDRLDYLVHSAAAPNPGDLLTQNIAEVEHALEVGAMALLYLVQPAMKQKLLVEGSSVLFLSGIVARLAIPHHGAIGVSKCVGECLIRYLAIELGPQKINFNTLSFGGIETSLFKTAYQNSAKPAIMPVGRRLEWEDVTAVAEFLLSPAAAMIRGQTVMVDGGVSSTVRRSS